MNTPAIGISAGAHQLVEAFIVTLRITPGHCCWDKTVQIRHLSNFLCPSSAWCNHFKHGESL